MVFSSKKIACIFAGAKIQFLCKSCFWGVSDKESENYDTWKRKTVVAGGLCCSGSDVFIFYRQQGEPAG